MICCNSCVRARTSPPSLSPLFVLNLGLLFTSGESASEINIPEIPSGAAEAAALAAATSDSVRLRRVQKPEKRENMVGGPATDRRGDQDMAPRPPEAALIRSSFTASLCASRSYTIGLHPLSLESPNWKKISRWRCVARICRGGAAPLQFRSWMGRASERASEIGGVVSIAPAAARRSRRRSAPPPEEESAFSRLQ